MCSKEDTKLAESRQSLCCSKEFLPSPAASSSGLCWLPVPLSASSLGRRPLSTSDAEVGGWCNSVSFVLAQPTLPVELPAALTLPWLPLALTTEPHTLSVVIWPARRFTPSPYCGIILHSYGWPGESQLRNDGWCSQPKLWAALCLTTLQEWFLAKARWVGGCLLARFSPEFQKSNGMDASFH